MIKKVLTFIAGTLILAPVLIAFCCNSLIIVVIAIVYTILVWHSPKFSVRVRKFWLEFWKINLRMTME